MIRLNVTNDYPVQDPKFNVGQDAGIDFFVPENTVAFREALAKANKNAINASDDCIYLKPNEAVLIPSGIKTNFPSNVALIAFNKSGIATKQQLIVGACVDDSSYQGILHLHVINTSNDIVGIPFGSKLTQFVPVLIDISGVQVEHGLTDDEFFTEKTSRGAGGFGSTGI